MLEGIYVFVGPSLRVAEARRRLDATYLPPARMGDIYNLVAHRSARAIGIIDGLFGRQPSVWHKEILFALSHGVRVFGGASMGALRAAELSSFGMEGVGEIFEMFHGGALEDDDEVAVAHEMEDADFRPVSEAMVNIRHGLRLAREARLISDECALRLEAHAKGLFFADRSWPRLLHDAAGLGLDSEERTRLRAFVRERAPNLKRDDAIAVLDRMATACAEQLQPHQPRFNFERTSYWVRLAEGLGRPADDVDTLRYEDIRRHALLSRDRDEVVRGALLLHLLRAEAGRLGISVESDKMAARARDALRSAQGVSSGATKTSKQRPQADEVSLAELLELETLFERVWQCHRQAVSGWVIPELRRRGAYEGVAEALAQRSRELAKVGVPRPTPADTGLDLQSLLRWYQSRYREIGRDLARHAIDLGFESLPEFLGELAAAYIAEHMVEQCSGSAA